MTNADAVVPEAPPAGYCWCGSYAGAQGWVVHAVGKMGVRGKDCVFYVAPTDKDTQMREVVRSSFVRVSGGLIDMACLNGDVPPRLPARSHQPCAHTDEVTMLLAQRDQLISMIEELIEKDDPDVDRVYYYRKIQEIRYGVRTPAPRD